MMDRLRIKFWWLNALSAIGILLSGCAPTQPYFIHESGNLQHYLDTATEVTYPDLNQQPLPDATNAQAPLTIENPEVRERWKMSLEEAISIALQNAHNLRTLGGRVATPVGQSAGSPPQSLTLNPDFAPSAYDVAIQETSSTGVAQALAAFDAQIQTQATWDRSDRPQSVNELTANSPFFLPELYRDNLQYQSEISKRAATGTQYFFRNVTNYDANNSPTRAHFSDWFTSFEMEMRHPLLRNSGTQVNRVPVTLARMNTDIAISDFEINVRNFVYEVEQAYWELHFYYHNLDAARTAYASAHAIWKQAKARAGELEGGEAANEAQSRQQYFSFKSRVQQAKSDLHGQESRLRYLLGISPTDGRLIEPVEDATLARVEFDWNSIRNESMIRSPELRRQRWRIKQNQIQLIAARNQLLPQFDLIALYRPLGMGDDLLRLGSRSGKNYIEDGSYAVDELLEGNYNEWRVGFDFNMPLGFRSETAQVRNQQLQLRRAERRLEDEELEIAHQVSAAVRRLRDRYVLAQTQFNALKAARDQVAAAETGYRVAQNVPLDVVLDAQSRQAQSEIDFFRAITEYNLAISEVHYRKGSLLEYNNVMLAEGPWPGKAYFDAEKRARERDGGYYIDYGFTRPAVVSRGTVNQRGNLTSMIPAMGSSSQLPATPAPIMTETVPAPIYDSPIVDPGTSSPWDGLNISPGETVVPRQNIIERGVINSPQPAVPDPIYGDLGLGQ